ncbi:MAG: hypothetical protein WAV21_00525 [Minisyncoccia bacterium]
MKKTAYLVGSFVFPLLAFAQANNLNDLGQQIIDIINTIVVPLIFAVAFVVFIWGVFQFFIVGGSDEEARGKGRDLMIWGLIGFFVMVSVWGLVNILVGTFDLNTGAAPDYPTVELP